MSAWVRVAAESTGYAGGVSDLLRTPGSPVRICWLEPNSCFVTGSTIDEWRKATDRCTPRHTLMHLLSSLDMCTDMGYIHVFTNITRIVVV
jgi:hypothetical protein